VAAEPSHLAITRAFIGSSLRALGQPEEYINDLRLAVSELMTVLVVSSQGLVDVVLSFEDENLLTTISGPTNLPPVPTEIVDLVKQVTADGLHLTGELWAIRTPLQ
jgi:anti-sigma regulatory factor (Ser/Thr protein kinase)